MKIQIHRPLREEVYDALRRAIVQGELPRGRRVVETELAGRLGISRTPVREALRKLEAEGLLSKGPGSNLVVNDLSSKDVEETFSIRAVLEGFAARLAAERATPEQVANEIFGKKVSTKWVRTHISVGRIKMGHKTIFYEEDTLRAWLARQVETA